MSDFVKRIAAAIDVLLLAGATVVVLLWLVGRPPFYTTTAPVMSVFTAVSLMIMVGVRLARNFLFAWPSTLSLAMLGLVLGGNLSSVLMLLTVSPKLFHSLGDLVLTSVMTSIGLMLFCVYDFIITLRRTPQFGFIFDDILIHLALVPGLLSLLGYLLQNPTYLSIGDDPRSGISPLDMVFMGGYAVSAVLSNPRLFLWQFLAAGWSNRLVFAALFANQFVAPVVVAYAFSTPAPTRGPGVELFVMLAGVVATLSFLLVQAWLKRRPNGTAAPAAAP